ncbi:unnamed protein product [Sphagnum balticum]
MIDTLFTFDDVLIMPAAFSTVPGRSEEYVSLEVEVERLKLKLPVISSNMDTVTGVEMAIAMAKSGGIGCLHRFATIDDNVKMFEESFKRSSVKPMVSIGISANELMRAEALVGAGAEVIVIDVANGAQQGMVDQVKALRAKYGTNIMIVAGNVATRDNITALARRTGAGAIDMYKVGIGPGSACTTRTKTGVGVPQLSAIIDCVASSYPVIADGGMKKAGDVAKALGAGAKMVMLGGMLAGTDETPGESDNGYKKYRGSASSESYEAQGKIGKHRTSEGESFMVKCKGPVENVLQDINGGVRSTCTYVNARNLRELHKNCVFKRVSANTVTENGAHGKS